MTQGFINPEYQGPQRRDESELYEKLGRLEAEVGNCKDLSRETRDELRQFRHDLFGVINPMKEQSEKNKTDIEWLKKWMPVLKIAGGTGVLAALAEAVRGVWGK